MLPLYIFKVVGDRQSAIMDVVVDWVTVTKVGWLVSPATSTAPVYPARVEVDSITLAGIFCFTTSRKLEQVKTRPLRPYVTAPMRPPNHAQPPSVVASPGVGMKIFQIRTVQLS